MLKVNQKNKNFNKNEAKNIQRVLIKKWNTVKLVFYQITEVNRFNLCISPKWNELEKYSNTYNEVTDSFTSSGFSLSVLHSLVEHIWKRYHFIWIETVYSLNKMEWRSQQLFVYALSGHNRSLINSSWLTNMHFSVADATDHIYRNRRLMVYIIPIHADIHWMSSH